jgi:uncharacterized protein (DUF1684 family)
VRQLLKWVPVLAVLSFACGGTVSVGAGGAGLGAAAGPSSTKYTRDIDEWHEGRIKRLTADDGWLTLVGLFPMPNGTHAFGSAEDNELAFPAGTPAHAGTLTVEDSVVTLTPSADVEMTLDDKRVGAMKLVSDKNGADPSKIQMGSIQFYVIDRPGSLYLRVKDAKSPVRKSFKGIDRFAVSEKWRFDAVLERYDPPHRVSIPNVLGFDEIVDCPGALVFSKDGKSYRLEPMSQEGDELFVVYGDATSGHDTYGGGRFVYVAMPGPDGKTVLDFNKSYNPPCVFTNFATCPLPHRDNVLPFRVEAGEKAWGDPNHHSPGHQ